MLEFLSSNAASIIIIAIIVVAVIFAIRSMIKTRKNGGCSCGCSNCPSSSTCHTASEKK